MSFPLINPYQQFVDSSGSPLVSGTVEFRDPTTNSLINTYPTADDADAQTNANDNPLTLSSYGAATTGIYLEDGVKYKVILKDAQGATVTTQDDVLCPIALPYLQTAAESAAGVTPTNVEYPPGNVLRYGADNTGSTDSKTAIQDAVNAMKQVGGNEVYIPGGTYSVSGEILIDENVQIRGDGSKTTIQPSAETFAVFRLEGATDYTLNRWRIGNLRIKWATQATNAAAVGIKFDDSGGVNRFPFGGEVEHLIITNASTGVMDDTKAWDIRFNQVRISQPYVDGFNCSKAGGTMYSFKNCYVDFNGGETGDGFKISSCHFLHMSDCAVDGMNSARMALNLTTCSGFIGTTDIEACITTGNQLALFSNCLISVNGLRTLGNTLSAADAAIVKVTSNSDMTFIACNIINTTATGANNTYGMNVTGSTDNVTLINSGFQAPTGGTGTHGQYLDGGNLIKQRIDADGIFTKGAFTSTPSEVTIASGAVTITSRFHTIDTESDAASDDLDTITGNGFTGQELILRAANDGRTVVVKHNTGNIQLQGGADFSLDTNKDLLCLMYSGTEWLEVSRSSSNQQTYTPTNVVTDRAYDADSTTTDELADVLGTLIADLQAQGIIG